MYLYHLYTNMEDIFMISWIHNSFKLNIGNKIIDVEIYLQNRLYLGQK